MAPELSSNWKKLQAQLKQKSRESESGKKKPALTQRHQHSIAKRRRIESRLTGAAGFIPKELPRKRLRMGIGSSLPDNPPKSASSTSLALWAEDNDISAKDLAEAYGEGLKDTSVRSSSSDKINAGLSKDVGLSQEVAIDCEMVGVGEDEDQEDRSVVARVSIVNFNGEQVYDSFVRPKEFVTDWRTHVSGVSPKNMVAARSFELVQNEVAQILKDRILVGHSVKNDLDVMMLTHPKKDIRDTSRFSEFRKYSGGKSPSLKKLAYEVLGVEIQGGQHSSLEDARATMLLYRRHKRALDMETASRYTRRTPNHAKGKSKPTKRAKNKH